MPAATATTSRNDAPSTSTADRLRATRTDSAMSAPYGRPPPSMRTMRRRWGSLVIALTAAALMTMPNAGAADGAAARDHRSTDATPPTAVVKVSPVDADGVLEPRYDVAHRYGGGRGPRRAARAGTGHPRYTPQPPPRVLHPGCAA